MADTITAAEPLPLVSAADLINPLLKVSDVMTTALRTCSPSSTVLEAALVMRDAGGGVVPVTDASRPVGLVTDRDIALALPEHEGELARMPIAEIMTQPVITVDRDATLDAAMERLGGEGVRRVLVVDSDGRLVGLLSWTDLVPHLSECGIGRVVSRIVENR